MRDDWPSLVKICVRPCAVCLICVPEAVSRVIDRTMQYGGGARKQYNKQTVFYMLAKWHKTLKDWTLLACETSF